MAASDSRLGWLEGNRALLRPSQCKTGIYNMLGGLGQSGCWGGDRSERSSIRVIGAKFFLDMIVRCTYYIVMRTTYHVLRGTILMMRKTQDDAELADFGRFSEPALLILISLAEEPRHGYSMTEDIEAIAGVRLGPGTLYGALARLEARGMIEPLKSEDRRNPYRLTALGERALRARLDSMMAVARTGQRRLASA